MPFGLDLPVAGPVGQRSDADRRGPGLDLRGHLAPGHRDVARRRARTDEDGGDGAAGVAGGREGRAHGEHRRAAGAVGELVQDDVAVAPALRECGEAAGRVGRRRTAPTVVVHPVVVGLEHRGETAGPDGAAERDRRATGHRGGERRVGARVRPGLGVRVELRGHVVDGRQAAIDALVVHDREDLLLGRQAGEADSETSIGPTPSWARASLMDVSQSLLAGAMFARVGRRQDPRGAGGCTGQSGRDGAHDDGADRQQKCRDTTTGTGMHAVFPLLTSLPSDQLSVRRVKKGMGHLD